jgi:cytochrome c-type biogenesis protein CcmH
LPDGRPGETLIIIMVKLFTMVKLFALLLVITAVTAAPATGLGGATAVDDETVDAVGARLRCVVCQNLSVADSPSEMAHQMRGIIRERLASGETPDQVVAYFVEKYGEWILLAPTARGFNLLVWAMPAVALGVGLVVVAFWLSRWTRPRRTPAPGLAAPDDPIDPSLRARIRSEMEGNA